MNKRLPLILSLVGMILLAVSLAYWILQLYQPPQRPLAAVPRNTVSEPPIQAAATLFGGQVATASVTSYQLTGIVAAGRDSVAIIVAEGSPPKALRVGKELVPGITLAEVHPRYVMLSDGGVLKRIDLAPDAKAAAPMGGAANDVNAPTAAPMPQAPAGNPVGAPQLASPVPEGPLPPSENTPEPPMSPGAVSQQMPGSNQMPTSNQMGPSGQAPAQGNVQPPAGQMAPPVQTSASPGGRVPPNQ